MSIKKEFIKNVAKWGVKTVFILFYGFIILFVAKKCMIDPLEEEVRGFYKYEGGESKTRYQPKDLNKLIDDIDSFIKKHTDRRKDDTKDISG
jgi:hypothetical protein